MVDNSDQEYLKLSLAEAKKSLEDGNFPVGAALVIDGKLIGTARNLIKSNSDWVSHAEHNLMLEHASLIKSSRKAGVDVTLYSSFEPCLMCFGTAVLCRISRIVYSCPDPYTGAVNIDVSLLSPAYSKMWPKIVQGDYKNESKALLIEGISKTADVNPKMAEMLGLLLEI